MTISYAERYVLRCQLSGTYLGVNQNDQQIEGVTSPETAWTFHTHEGAVTHARWIGEVLGETPDVVKLPF
ncbi:MAG TPA: hypothetical protein QF626_02355 [Prochlorococcaceae cyanobacterium Fu_MAG_50]|nr:hypothetical protein [Prochlorococcaceae cyanobacterium Fu_MAG_50]